MTRGELTDALRAAFCAASGHQDGWDAVGDKAMELLTCGKPNYEAVARVLDPLAYPSGEAFNAHTKEWIEDRQFDALRKAREVVYAARLPRGWADPPSCVVCSARGVVAEIRCRDHAAPEVGS